MKSSKEMRQVPLFVNLETALAQYPDFFQKCQKQINALKGACASDNVPIFIGGIDAYKLITKTYNPDSDTPLFYIVESDMDETILKGRAFALEPSISTVNIHLETPMILSSGDFRIVARNGKVYHPFPDIKPKNNSPKPVFIDSCEFIFDNIINTPSLPSIIQQSSHDNQSIRSLSLILVSYYFWLRSGKVLSLDVATAILDLSRRDTNKYSQLLADLQACTKLPKELLFDDFLHYIFGAAQYVVDISNRAIVPLMSEKEALKAQVESLTKSLSTISASAEQLKKSNESLHLENLLASGVNQLNVIQNSEKQQLIKENDNLRSQITLLFDDSIDLTKQLETVRSQLKETKQERDSAKEESKKSKDKGLKFEEKYNQQKDENKKLTDTFALKSKKSESTLQQTIAEKDQIINDLKKQLSEQQSGLATLSTRNHKLTQANTALLSSLEEARAHTQKPTRSPETLVTFETATAVPVINSKSSKAATIINPPKTETETQAITKPKKAVLTSLQLKYALAQYILNLFTTPEGKKLPFFIPNLDTLPHDNSSANPTLAQAIELLPKDNCTLQEASDMAAAFRTTCERLRGWPDIADKSIHIGTYLQELDAELDVILCRRNIYLAAPERWVEHASYISFFIDFLKAFNHSHKLLLNAKHVNNLLTGKDTDSVLTQQLLQEKLDRISVIHHFFLKNKKIIIAAQNVYKITLVSSQLKNTNVHKAGPLTGENLRFGKEVSALYAMDDEIKQAQLRFISSLKPTDGSDITLTLEMFESITNSFVLHYRLTISAPFITDLLKKPSISAVDAKSAYTNIMKAIVTAVPREKPLMFIALYFDLFRLWSLNDLVKKIQYGHPLLRAASPLLDEKFLKGNPKDQAIDDQIALAINDVKTLFRNLPETDVSDIIVAITSNYRSGLNEKGSHEISVLTKVEARLKPRSDQEVSPKVLTEMMCIHLTEYIGRLVDKPGSQIELSSFRENFKNLQSILSISVYSGVTNTDTYLNMLGAVSEAKSMHDAEEAVQCCVIVFEAFSRIHLLDKETQQRAVADLILHLDTQFSTTTSNPDLPEEMRFMGWLRFITENHNFVTQWNAYRKEIKGITSEPIQEAMSNAVILYRTKLAKEIKQSIRTSGNLFKCLFKHRETILTAHRSPDANNGMAELNFIIEFNNNVKKHNISIEQADKAYFYFAHWLETALPAKAITADELGSCIKKIAHQFAGTIESNPLPQPAVDAPKSTTAELNRDLIISLINEVKALNENQNHEFDPKSLTVDIDVANKVAAFNDVGIASLDALASKHLFITDKNRDYSLFVCMGYINNVCAMNELHSAKGEDKKIFTMSIVSNLLLCGLNLQLPTTISPHTVPSVHRFNDVREMFKQLYQFLSDPLLDDFCDPQTLREILTMLVSEAENNKGLLYNNTSSKEIIMQYLQVAKVYDFLMSNKNILLSAHSTLTHKTGFKPPHIQCYAKYEKLAVPAEARLVAEKYFVTLLEQQKSPLTEEGLQNLKAALAVAQAGTQNTLLPSGMGMDLTGLMKSYNKLKETIDGAKKSIGVPRK